MWAGGWQSVIVWESTIEEGLIRAGGAVFASCSWDFPSPKNIGVATNIALATQGFVLSVNCGECILVSTSASTYGDKYNTECTSAWSVAWSSAQLIIHHSSIWGHCGSVWATVKDKRLHLMCFLLQRQFRGRSFGFNTGFNQLFPARR